MWLAIKPASRQAVQPASTRARVRAARRPDSDPQVHYSALPYTLPRGQHSAVIAPLPPSTTHPHTSGLRRRQPCPAEYIASYSTPDRPNTPLLLIHTRVLSTCDLYLRFSDHCNAHCPSATGAHHDFELSELYSWIALLQLQPALDTLYRTALG